MIVSCEPIWDHPLVVCQYWPYRLPEIFRTCTRRSSSFFTRGISPPTSDRFSSQIAVVPHRFSALVHVFSWLSSIVNFVIHTLTHTHMHTGESLRLGTLHLRSSPFRSRLFLAGSRRTYRSRYIQSLLFCFYSTVSLSVSRALLLPSGAQPPARTSLTLEMKWNCHTSGLERIISLRTR